MSAIAGVWQLNGATIDPDALTRVIAPLAYRGPDRSAVWLGDTIGLGHHLLRTTPESAYDAMPYTHPSGHWVITADARIDNRDELVHALALDGRPRMSDSELILHAYIAWGDRCAHRLLGDFVFAIWDVRNRSLFCARDQFGVRPLYYYHSENVFVFASELSGVRTHPDVSDRIDDAWLSELLIPIVSDTVGTCYTDVRRLAPAHTMTVSPRGIVHRRYWQLDPLKQLPPASDGEYAEALRALFTKAVTCRVRSAYPMGSTLSGGLDSSSNVVTARPSGGVHFPGQLHTFSAVYPGQACDESPYINAVIRQGGITPHVVSLNDLAPLDGLPDAVRRHGSMFFGPNLCIHLPLYKMAREHGVRGVLDGFDGDTTICHGVAHLGGLARQGHWLAAARESHAFAKRMERSSPKTFLSRVLIPATPPRWRAMARKVRSGTDVQWDPIIHPEFAGRMRLTERLRELHAHNAENRSIEPVRDTQYRALRSGFFPYALEVFDTVGLSFGLRALFPFCDIRLIEFCLALPPEQKIRNGWTRFVMRNAMNHLPDAVRWRQTKANVESVVTNGMLRWHRETIEHVVHSPPPRVTQYIDTRATAEIFRRYATHPTPSDAMSLWKVVMLSSWLADSGQEGRTA